jgi:macrolide-specific efflux system membrane fusion protein
VIEAVNVTSGTDAPSGSAVILDAGGLQASATIAEADLSRVSAGQPATVTISAIDGDATGKVASIAPTATSGNNNSSVVTCAVTLSLTEVPTAARAGMTASVAITVATAENVLAVPAIALQTAGTGYAVRVMAADGTVTSQDVQVGLVTSDLAEITSGLTEGQNVVIGVSTARNSSSGTTGGLGGGGLGGALGGGGFRGPDGGRVVTR